MVNDIIHLRSDTGPFQQRDVHDMIVTGRLAVGPANSAGKRTLISKSV